MNYFKSLYEKAEKIEAQPLVLAGAEDEEALNAVIEAVKKNIIIPILVGDKEVIKEKIKGTVIENARIVNASTPYETAEKSVKEISQGEGKILMKGLIKTAILLKAALSKEWGLRTGNLLSHVAVADVNAYDKYVFITDGGMNIKPTVEEKAQIISNAVGLAKSLGVEIPKVACITAVEVVNPQMPETLDCAILSKMSQRGQIKNCIVDGPLGLDNAMSQFAADIKNVKGDVAGNADILLVPDIHCGNFLGKSVEYFGSGMIAGLIMGAKVPIVVVSRADKSEAKLASIMLSVINVS